MSIGRRVGYFFLGFAPFAAVLMWQIIVTYIGMFVFMIQQAMVDRSVLNDMDRLLTDFQVSPIYSVLIFITYIGYILFILWYYLMFCKGKKTGNYKMVLKPHRIIMILASGILLQIGIDMILELVFGLFPALYESYSAISEALGTETIWMVLSICILAPIGEEVIFRGLTYRIFRRAIPWQAAMIVQAVLFGVYHLNLVQGVYAALLGLVLGYLVYRYESVLPGILLHIAINSSSYLVGYLLPAELEDSIPGMIIVGIVTTSLALFLINRVGRGGISVKTDEQEPELVMDVAQSIDGNQ